MEKEFIGYSEALALKDLGFDKASFGVYYISDPYKEVVMNGPYVYGKNSGIYKKYNVLAPTFSQAYRWFREKYGFLGVPNWYSGGFYCYTIKDVTDKVAPELFTEFLTYEEAELKCIDKLIETVKRKK